MVTLDCWCIQLLFIFSFLCWFFEHHIKDTEGSPSASQLRFTWFIWSASIMCLSGLFVMTTFLTLSVKSVIVRIKDCYGWSTCLNRLSWLIDLLIEVFMTVKIEIVSTSWVCWCVQLLLIFSFLCFIFFHVHKCSSSSFLFFLIGYQVRVTRSLVWCVCFVDRCLSFCTFFFWPLCCLFFFDIRILITPLIFTNSLCLLWIKFILTLISSICLKLTRMVDGINWFNCVSYVKILVSCTC
jgi:hypothetical protein